MTAAVLQFNQHSRPSKPLKHQHTSNHTKHQSPSNNNTDYIDTPMTKEYHQIMIDLLNTEHPFRAVRLALSFNEANGFCLIDEGIIRKWKKEISFSVNQNLENEIAKSKCDFSGIEVENNDFPQIKKLEIKCRLEDGYRQLLEI